MLLAPYRVLDLTDHRGHLAGLGLATLGAEVIRIEPPGGSPVRSAGPTWQGESLTFAAYDRGKRSVVIDVATEAGRDQLRRLAAGADVLIESGEPGEWAALGLGPDDLAVVNPALVYVSISGHGRTGPKAAWRATDLTIMASACTLAFNGDRDRAPVRVALPQAFHFAGAAAIGATIAALIERAGSGLGQVVDVAAQQVVPIATQSGVLAHRANAPVPQRSGGGASVGPIQLRFVYPASDGYVSITHVFGDSIGPVTARLMQVVHEEGFCSAEMAGANWVDYAVLLESGQYPLEHWDEARAAVEAFTSSHTKAELLDLAMERKLLMAPIADPADVVGNSHWAERGYFGPIGLPSGAEVTGPTSFAQFSPTPTSRLDEVRPVGADTDAVLSSPERAPATAGPALADHLAAVQAPAGPVVEREGPLAGLRVLDFTWSLAGPLATRVLADLGATVVKVESTTRLDAGRGFLPVWNNEAGAENSALFDNANAGKLSLTLNPGTPEGRDVVLDLVGWADVVVESFSPRAMKAWNLGYDVLRERNPSIIMLSTCLTGQYGALANFAGFGNLGAALAGFYGLAGWPDRPPAGPFGAYTDYTSTHFVAASLLAAVDHRRRTGEGAYIDLAQAEAAMYFLAPALLAAAADGTVLARAGNRDPAMAPHGVYPCAGDDRWIAIACQDDDQWRALCSEMSRADLAADAGLATLAGRQARHDELDEIISAWTAGRDDDELQHQLQGAGVAAHRVQNSAECLDDPQLAALGQFLELDHPDRGCVVEATRFRLSRTPGRPAGRAPMLGEHTFEVLTDLLGYDGDRVAELAAAEVLE